MSAAPGSPRTTVHLVSLALTLVASLVALLAPTFAVAVARHTGSGDEFEMRESLLAYMGPMAILLLLIPVAIAALPVVFRPAGTALTVVTAVLLNVWVFLGLATVGMFYIPAGVGVLAAIFAPRHGRGRPVAD
ncbi:hypothetical protein [Microbacterium stercoris]|uniref:Uncharacterized protein n=1 Tax=Microbacterium stercoris TaxID=2820289 RepID=A0A939QK83_9MICO|nr:hypothetical protein [Microbacterium stercoris]MBO3662455.1 hypothetical protein [Microbacterium stercoris]MBO3664447.1 hypothetical protein [Microbacterium stercoris]